MPKLTLRTEVASGLCGEQKRINDGDTWGKRGGGKRGVINREYSGRISVCVVCERAFAWPDDRLREAELDACEEDT